MGAGGDSSEMSEGRDQADAGVNAHAEGGNVVEKNRAAAAIRFVRLADQRADHRIVATRLVANRRAQPIMFLAQAPRPSRERSATEIRPAGDDDPGRFAFGVGFDDVEVGLLHALIRF
jgi:hypothetical protein